MRIPLLLLAVLPACAAHVDPFAADRHRIADVRSNPTRGPDLSIVAADSLLTEVVDELLMGFRAQGPLGMPIAVDPTVERVSLSVRDGEDCDGCLGLGLMATGAADVGAAGARASDVRWDANLQADLLLTTAVTAAGFESQVQWGSVPIRSDVRIDGLSPGLDAIASGFVGAWIAETVTQALAAPVALGTLRADAIPLADLRVHPGDGLQLDVLLSTGEGAALPPIARPDKGWVMALPLDTVLGLARYHALRDAEQRYFLEPVGIALEGEDVTVALRIWKRGRRERYRRWEVRGTLGLDGTDLVLTPTEATELDKLRWGGGLDTAVLQAKIRKWVEQGEIRIPLSFSTPVGQRTVYITATDITGDAGTLTVKGTLRTH